LTNEREKNGLSLLDMSSTDQRDTVLHPAHYTFSAIQPIDVIEAWALGFHLGNCIKYIARAGRKGARLEDLQKARWYLDREIGRMDDESEEDELEEEPQPLICTACNGTGTSSRSYRPDDYGPHFVCASCRGTGVCRHAN
jgi:Protein of unknwon function (DUF3310)